MWIISLSDNSDGEIIEVVASSLEEVQGIVEYVANSDGILELEHMEQRWMVFGLQGLKDMSETGEPGKL